MECYFYWTSAIKTSQLLIQVLKVLTEQHVGPTKDFTWLLNDKDSDRQQICAKMYLTYNKNDMFSCFGKQNQS